MPILQHGHTVNAACVRSVQTASTHVHHYRMNFPFSSINQHNVIFQILDRDEYRECM